MFCKAYQRFGVLVLLNSDVWETCYRKQESSNLEDTLLPALSRVLCAFRPPEYPEP
jgi:hypothetical protein